MVFSRHVLFAKQHCSELFFQYIQLRVQQDFHLWPDPVEEWVLVVALEKIYQVIRRHLVSGLAQEAREAACSV